MKGLLAFAALYAFACFGMWSKFGFSASFWVMTAIGGFVVGVLGVMVRMTR